MGIRYSNRYRASLPLVGHYCGLRSRLDYERHLDTAGADEPKLPMSAVFRAVVLDMGALPECAVEMPSVDFVNREHAEASRRKMPKRLRPFAAQDSIPFGRTLLGRNTRQPGLGGQAHTLHARTISDSLISPRGSEASPPLPHGPSREYACAQSRALPAAAPFFVQLVLHLKNTSPQPSLRAADEVSSLSVVCTGLARASSAFFDARKILSSACTPRKARILQSLPTGLHHKKSMKPAIYGLLCVPLAGAIVLLCPLVARPDPISPHSKFSGTYLSGVSKAEPLMNVSLGEDGTATVTEDPGTGIRILFGHWVDSVSQITVTFDALEGKPPEPPMVFELGHNGLQAVTWNHAVWGGRTPPPMKKGFKVKNAYWLTTIR